MKKKKNIAFKLTENQKFLKSFLSPNTPYNSMLLFHGTGVGKTCSSISIAEQYSEELKNLNKKVIILLNPSIEANFVKNIFNIQKVIKQTPYYQCTGSKYLDEIKIDLDIFNTKTDEEKKKIQEQIQSKISKIIKGRYEFYGYQKFANLIENIQHQIKEKYNESDYIYYFNKELKKRFSNTVMIIDEVHNIKKTTDLKVLPPLLEKVVQNAINMKLLLLSATPMFDTSEEIFFLINLMLRNDNRSIINVKKYMDINGTMIPSMRDDFIRKIHGYISYMRGEDPYRFPKRLYPNSKLLIDSKNMPSRDKNGQMIDEDNKIKELKIVPCVMKGRQLELYEHMETSNETGSFNQPGIMCSNIVFPSNKEMRETRITKLENFISDKGFNNIIETTKNGKDIKYNIIDDDYKDFFKLGELSKYSTKIVELVKNIDKNDGIHFVYSQYLNSGIIPIALALEKLGYTKYGNPLTNNKETKLGNYIIISGNSDLSSNAYAEYLKIQDSNKKGDKIKIILGTQTAAEGLDFSYIRHVHILEPWFHLNRLEQVIGRGIRNCSHIDLDTKDRNVTIYLYAAVKEKKDRTKYIETIDLETYRNAENKSKKMAEIEYLLKTSAVDCLLNKHGNYFGKEYDVDFSKKCNYKKCDYECNPSTIDKTINKDTINKKIIEDNINDVMNEIIKLYKENYYYTLDDFIKILDIDSLLIFFALNKLLNYTGKILSKNGSKGKIIHKNGYYIFIKNNSSKFISFNNIRKNNSNTKKYNSFNISRNNTLSELEKLDNIPIKSNVINNFSFEYIETQKDTINKQIKKIENIYSIPLEYKELIIQYLIIKLINNELTDDEETIIDSLYNILYCKEDLICDSLKNNKIWGYKIADNKVIRYMKCNIEEKKFKKGNLNDIKQIKKSFIKKSKKEKDPADIIGYYELIMPQNSLKFKIRDHRKGTQNTGAICDNKKSAQIIKYIKEFKKKPISKDKKSLCLEFEQILNDIDLKDKKYRYLYGPEETIEYELNKKKN